MSYFLPFTFVVSMVIRLNRSVQNDCCCYATVKKETSEGFEQCPNKNTSSRCSQITQNRLELERKTKILVREQIGLFEKELGRL